MVAKRERSRIGPRNPSPNLTPAGLRERRQFLAIAEFRFGLTASPCLAIKLATRQTPLRVQHTRASASAGIIKSETVVDKAIIILAVVIGLFGRAYHLRRFRFSTSRKGSRSDAACAEMKVAICRSR